jgi:hypothetical protein
VTLRDDDDFKEGVMAFGDIGLDGPAYDVTALYISAVRIGERMSNFFMFGGNFGDGISDAGVYIGPISGQGAGIILNNSFFYHFTSNFIVGLEMNLYVDVGQRTGSYVNFYPQVSISSTSYARKIRTKVLFGSFFQLRFGSGAKIRTKNARVNVDEIDTSSLSDLLNH